MSVRSKLFCIPPWSLRDDGISNPPKLGKNQIKHIMQSAQLAFESFCASDDQTFGQHTLKLELSKYSGNSGQKNLQHLLESASASEPTHDEHNVLALNLLMCALLEARETCWRCSDVKYNAICILGSQIVRLVTPELLEKPAPHIFAAGLRCLLAVPFAGNWHFLSGRHFYYPDEQSQQGAYHCKVASWLDDALSTHYDKKGYIPYWQGTDGEINYHEGCAIQVIHLDCQSYLESSRAKFPGHSNLEYAQWILAFMGLPETSENVQWVLRKAISAFPNVIVLTRCHGLTHPRIPFAASTVRVVIEDIEVYNRIVYDVLPRLGVSVKSEDDTSAFIPISFGPAISDNDRNLQRAYLEEARGSMGAATVLQNALQAVARESLSQVLPAIGDIPEVDFHGLLSRAGKLVRDALAAVHAFERRHKILMQFAEAAVHTAVDNAWEEVVRRQQLRTEWARREHWVLKQSRLKVGPKRGRNRVRSEAAQSHDSRRHQVDAKRDVETVVVSLEARAQKYERTALAISSLERAGLAQISNTTQKNETLVLEEKRQKVLTDGADTVFGSEEIESLPSKTSHDARGASAITKSGTKSASQLPGHSVQTSVKLLEATTVRDQQMTLAHVDEIALKLGMEMSLADMSGNHTTDCICEPQDGSDGKNSALESHSNLEHVLLLEFARDPLSFHQLLLECPELEDTRRALQSNGFDLVLPSKSMAFVRPEQYQATLEVVRLMGLDLKSRHVLVAAELEKVVVDVVMCLPRCEKVRRKGEAKLVPLGFADAIVQAGVSVVISRTFLDIPIPCSLRSGPTKGPVTASTTDAHRGPNPRLA